MTEKEMKTNELINKVCNEINELLSNCEEGGKKPWNITDVLVNHINDELQKVLDKGYVRIRFTSPLGSTAKMCLGDAFPFCKWYGVQGLRGDMLIMMSIGEFNEIPDIVKHIKEMAVKFGGDSGKEIFDEWSDLQVEINGRTTKYKTK